MKGCFAPSFRRYVPTCLAFSFSLAFTALVLLGGSAATTRLEPGDTADAPPFVVFMLAMAIFVAALPIGAVFVPFRDLVLKRSFPFVRRGSLVLVAAPLVAFALPGLTLGQKAVIFSCLEIYLLLSTMVFVGLRWMFRETV